MNWLPVSGQIQFKVRCISHWAMQKKGPKYLSCRLTPYRLPQRDGKLLGLQDRIKDVAVFTIRVGTVVMYTLGEVLCLFRIGVR